MGLQVLCFTIVKGYKSLEEGVLSANYRLGI
jgi:hypothetical protein